MDQVPYLVLSSVQILIILSFKVDNAQNRYRVWDSFDSFRDKGWNRDRYRHSDRDSDRDSECQTVFYEMNKSENIHYHCQYLDLEGKFIEKRAVPSMPMGCHDPVTGLFPACTRTVTFDRNKIITEGVGESRS